MHSSKRALVASISLSAFLVTLLAVNLGTIRRVIAAGQQTQGGRPAQEEADEDRRQARNGAMPENNSYGVSSTPMEYAKMIEPELGIPPIVDCGTSVEIPIYVNEVKYTGNPGLHGCDNPSLQVGDCMSGSSLQRYEGVTADGTPLPHVVWVSYCRHEGRPGTEDYDWDSVQMIGYNSKTGATAFFESGRNSEWTYTDPETNRLMGKMPGTDDPDAFNRGYSTPGKTQCAQCHQNDPFIHNPYIDSAKLPSDPSQPVIPRNRTRNANMKFDNPYYVIGASHWDMRTIHIEGNACLQCHRIGMKTLEEFIGDHWNPNEHMPPNDPGSLSEDLQELFDCWQNSPENTPGCDWIVPPAGDSLGHVVRDEYPHKAGFNKPNPKMSSYKFYVKSDAS